MNQGFGLWLSAGGTVEVPVGSSHNGIIRRNPVPYGFTRERIDAIYREFGEKPGFEGKAQEKIVREATTCGWIRIRLYHKPDEYVSVQFDRLEPRIIIIKAWVREALEQRLLYPDSMLCLTGFIDGTEMDRKAGEFLEGE